MNLGILPYHDWRKILNEGNRTRDSHFIHHLGINDSIDNIIIINRPISYLELVVKKKIKKINGKIIFKSGNGTLYKVRDQFYVFDYKIHDFLGPILKKQSWFFSQFSNIGFYKSLECCLESLNVKLDFVLNQNIFAADFVKRLNIPSVFDAWDNFVLFPENSKYYSSYYNAYSSLAKSSEVWVTNSEKNIKFYSENYSVDHCHLIKNGVDLERFRKEYEKPHDMRDIPGIIIGFGGKISHLFDVELFNYLTEENPNKSFVLVGQILNKSIFNKILKRSNVFYLGDIHYDNYPHYVVNFDVGIIPYVTNELEHGADTIKMYEFLAAGLKVIGTKGAGMESMNKYVNIACNKEEFSSLINTNIDAEEIDLPEFFTWKSKTEQLLNLLRSLKSK